ncbi:MAG: 3-phosphoshikimate 1-carboxyvinyltransferase [Deltaproteobacteria bacterium]|nr:3-phosphoshikimate 1-carboxyvinyltransferase [Deltaproteobacteria bacterium]
MIEIEPKKIETATVRIPGSKSYTHRVLIAAALSDGVCKLHNALRSEDTLLTAGALRQLGIHIEHRDDLFIVTGSRGVLKECKDPIYLGNSGTSMRFLTAVTVLGKGRYFLSGNQRMQQRPIQDLVEGLNQIGVSVRTVNQNGCPPVEIKSRRVDGGSVTLNCEKSSQFLSALLLIAPYTKKGLEITVTRGPVSRPYIDMTLEVMEKLGVTVYRDGYTYFKIPGSRVYKAGTYTIEADCSQAGYFWAAAAITGAGVTVQGITRDSKQGDLGLLKLLEAMGCRVSFRSDGICVQGGRLSGIDADMGDMPDMVPTLAVVAAFAEGTTRIRNVAHLRIKESDRLGAVAAELSKMGIAANITDTGICVRGGTPGPAVIDTYGDHRIAMSFAIAGLAVPGVFINDEECVEKSFPRFWDVLESL